MKQNIKITNSNEENKAKDEDQMIDDLKPVEKELIQNNEKTIDRDLNDNNENEERDEYYIEDLEDLQLEDNALDDDYYLNALPHFKEFDENGNLIMLCDLKNGQPDGLFMKKDSEGNTEIEGYFEKGKKVGKWILYNNYEKTKMLVYYSNDKINGKVTKCDNNNQVIEEMFFKDNKLHGKFIQYDNIGKIRLEMMFENGKKHGLCCYYNDEGDNTMHFINNKIAGQSIYNNNHSSRYHKTISNYKDGYAHGNKETYNRGGKLTKMEIYKYGKRQTGKNSEVPKPKFLTEKDLMPKK